MAIQWGNNSALAGFQNALALGADIGGAIRQNREDGALAAFMTASGKPAGDVPTGAPAGALGTPAMPTQWGGNGGGIVPTETQKSESQAAYDRLAKINPRLAMQAQDRVAGQEAARAKLMQEQRAANIRTKAAQGDPAALQQLVGIDFDSWKALDANQRKLVADQNSYIGQSALRISQLPPEQRAAAWDQVIDNGVARGFKELAEKRGQYSDKALTDAIDGAGLVEKFLKLAEPDWRVVPEGGVIVNARDPSAIASLNGAPPPQQAPTPTTVAPETALRNATARGYVLPDEAASIKANLGSNGQAAFEGWLEQNKVKMVTRTGTAPDGRKVVQFSDGTTQYAD